MHAILREATKGQLTPCAISIGAAQVRLAVRPGAGGGGHLFIREHADDVLAAIVEEVTASGAGRAGNTV